MGMDDVKHDDETADDNHGVPPRMLSAPSAPSRQEAQEHAITHLPFRSWCPFCVRGKSKSSPHKRNVSHDEDGVPVVSFDYCFMGDREATDLSNVTILVGRDRRSRCYMVVPVPQKGVDPDEYSVRRGLRYLEFLGYKTVILKSDQEASLGKIFSASC